jgi:ATP-dependent exoDNAse (exonuclease V) beta subunit
MKEQNVKPLKILNASAGSGKTFNLVKEYLKILLGDHSDSTRFSKILAMTFTNKAAIEMKTRIIEMLDEVAYKGTSDKKTISYVSMLASALGIKPKEVTDRATIALKGILHRYEDFHVMTIDKFNLRLIRSFSRDLDLPGEFDVILNEKEIIERVVDLLMSQLGIEDVQTLTTLMLSYAKENVDEGEHWDIRERLISFSMILTKEKNQQLIGHLLQMDFSPHTKKELWDLVHEMEKTFLDACKSLHSFYHSLGIPEDRFPGKSNATKPLERLASFERIPETEKLFTAKYMESLDSPVPAGREFPDTLKQKIRELYSLHSVLYPKVEAHRSFLRNFYNMALLQYIAKTLDTVKKEDQQIRISEFNSLISKLVQDEKAPFIYERLGTRYRNFLLDEFQDTSRLQWLNMVPLVHEAISKKDLNLIVGDPKQSIYRFKNGVAEQFVALPKIYNPENSTQIDAISSYFDRMGFMEPLGENWRSAKEIVEFNNSFFEILRSNLPKGSKDYYNSVSQLAMSDKSGYVQITSVEGNPSFDSQMSWLIQRIEECRKDGYELGDLCILSDTNAMANGWAVALNELDYKVVSAESLLVQNEVKIKLIISYLKLRLQPASKMEQKKFADLFFRVKNESNPYEHYRSYIVHSVDSKGRRLLNFDDQRFLTEHFGTRDTFFKKYETLYELIESFYRMMGWTELKNPYLHHFADFVHDFERKKGPDLKGLIDQYQKDKGKLAIQLPESRDALKIMTIHKSKGLEFPVVLIPFLNFNTEMHKDSRFLVEIEDLVLYTRLTKGSSIPQIRSLNQLENEQIFTDKVNLCYVGFTRPEERLYVLNEYSGENFGKKAHAYFSALPHTINESGQLLIESGTLNVKGEKDRDTVNNDAFFYPTIENDLLWFPEISLRNEDLNREDQVPSEEQLIGNLFHLAISRIDNENQINDVLHEMILNGEIEKHRAKDLHQMLEKLFACKGYTELISNAHQILSEQPIIVDRERIQRPDKLILRSKDTMIVDFKTGIPSDNDLKQLMEYNDTLSEMNLPNVKGFIYYTQFEELRQIC